MTVARTVTLTVSELFGGVCRMALSKSTDADWASGLMFVGHGSRGLIGIQGVDSQPRRVHVDRVQRGGRRVTGGVGDRRPPGEHVGDRVAGLRRLRTGGGERDAL